jgi:putative ABC transport system permease protein
MRGRDIGQAASIATSAFFHERMPMVCTVLGLAAILAPLLVLFGLKFGVVSALRERLERDPRIRVLQPIGQGSYDAAWFSSLQAQPGTGFLVPTTRFLAATISLGNPAQPDADRLTAELVPTAPGDPLLDADLARDIAKQVVARELRVAVSRAVADRMGIDVGAQIEGRIGRLMDDQPQALHLRLVIGGLLPASASDRTLVLVPLPLLLAAEDYREGFAVPALNAEGQKRPEGERRFASFRLYAETIDAVAPLRDWLAGKGVQTVTREAEIDMVQRLDGDLGRLFLVLAALGATGFLLSLALGLWASIARQRRSLSLLRLIGFPAGAIAVFPVVQGLWAALLSLVVACAATFAAQPVIERMMASSLPQGGQVFRLRAEHVAAAALITFACTALAAAYGGARAARIAPSEGLRDD